jgi:hypothetical protein
VIGGFDIGHVIVMGVQDFVALIPADSCRYLVATFVDFKTHLKVIVGGGWRAGFGGSSGGFGLVGFQAAWNLHLGRLISPLVGLDIQFGFK